MPVQWPQQSTQLTEKVVVMIVVMVMMIVLDRKSCGLSEKPNSPSSASVPWGGALAVILEADFSDSVEYKYKSTQL